MFGQLDSPTDSAARFGLLRMHCGRSPEKRRPHRALRAYRGRERPEVRDKLIDVRFIVLDGDEPLLDLAPRRQEDPAVVLEEPVSVAHRVVDGQELAVV